MTRAPRLAVGIASRGRSAALARCIASLRVLDGMIDEIVVVDDGSEPALEPAVRAALGTGAPLNLRMIRFSAARGLAAARSEAVVQTRASYVLNLDDDTVMLSADALQAALEVLERDPAVFAVAFAQAAEDGSPLPLAAQPAPVTYPCLVAAFIGFAHLVRRDRFVELGGYREQLGINGEERELCLRALDRGLHVVYLPDARVAHLADQTGRDVRRYLHLTVRNGVLSSIYDDPVLLVLVRVPVRLLAYFRMRRGWGVVDPGGFRHIIRWLGGDLRAALALRRPVRWSTIRRWRSVSRRPEPYQGPA